MSTTNNEDALVTAILMPESWTVQPTVVSVHSAHDPERKRRFSVQAERLAKTIRPGAAARYADARRLKAVGFNPPDEVALRILRWVLMAGDPRYWSWSATKREAKGLVRNSLEYELCTAKSHIKRSLKRLIDDGLVEVKHKQDRRETLQVTTLGRTLLAEACWRHQLRDWVPEARARFEAFGYQEASIVIDRVLLIEGGEHDRRADVVWAATEGYELGERNA